MSVKVLNTRRTAALARPVTVATVVALLSGCYSYRIQHVDNPVKLPSAWDAGVTENAKDGVAKEWWKGFHSKVLEDLIAEAQRDNPNIIGVNERMKQAERSFQTTRDGLFPDVSLTAGASKASAAVSRTPTPFSARVKTMPGPRSPLPSA